MFEFHFLKKSKKHSSQDIEPQEIFLDNLAKKKEEEIGVSMKKFEVPLSQKALLGFLVFSLVLTLVLFGKTFQLQILKHKEFSVLAQGNKYIINFIKADRGIIYDKNGVQMVFNKPSFNLILNKSELPEEKEDVLRQVAQIIEKDYEDLKKEVEENDTLVILSNLDHQKLILLETRIQDLPGFEIEKNTIREYKESFSHLIGYTGIISSQELKDNAEFYSSSDYIGLIGIEKTYEEALRRNPGKLRIERDAMGTQVSKEVISLPESGKSLVLHLDFELQKKIENELKETLERVGSKKAVGIALDPKNGGVLALVSLPGFDNNLFSKNQDEEILKDLLKDEEDPLFNRAITGKYATGSTIKPLIAVAALEEGIISDSNSLNCKGKITIPHRYDPEISYEYKDWSTHGWTDIRKAIAESCNVFFFTIGGGYEKQKGLGPTRIKKYLELFNWGSETGIDIPNENKGFIPSPEWKRQVKQEGWWDGDTYNLSIGQGDIMITPLQVAVSFAAIANKGTLYKPKAVKEIRDSEKNLIQEIKPEIISQDFISPENLDIVRQGMRKAVTGVNAPQASSVLLNSLPVTSAAKTGTAQTGLPNYYHNWITVFAPYDDPEIVLVIMIENVYKAQVAALPTARNVLNWYFSE